MAELNKELNKELDKELNKNFGKKLNEEQLAQLAIDLDGVKAKAMKHVLTNSN